MLLSAFCSALVPAWVRDQAGQVVASIPMLPVHAVSGSNTMIMVLMSCLVCAEWRQRRGHAEGVRQSAPAQMHLRRAASAGEEGQPAGPAPEAEATQAAPVVQAEKFVLLEGIPQVRPLSRLGAAHQQGWLDRHTSSVSFCSGGSPRAVARQLSQLSLGATLVVPDSQSLKSLAHAPVSKAGRARTGWCTRRGHVQPWELCPKGASQHPCNMSLRSCTAARACATRQLNDGMAVRSQCLRGAVVQELYGRARLCNTMVAWLLAAKA